MFFSAASAIAATPLQKNKEIVLYFEPLLPHPENHHTLKKRN
jgi:hypothetical protein